MCLLWLLLWINHWISRIILSFCLKFVHIFGLLLDDLINTIIINSQQTWFTWLPHQAGIICEQPQIKLILLKMSYVRLQCEIWKGLIRRWTWIIIYSKRLHSFILIRGRNWALCFICCVLILNMNDRIWIGWVLRKN